MRLGEHFKFFFAFFKIFEAKKIFQRFDTSFEKKNDGENMDSMLRAAGSE